MTPQIPLFPAKLANTVGEVRGTDWMKLYLDRPPNFWDIIEYGSGSYENRYNRMLRWLLDPNESHGLGSHVVDGLLGLEKVNPSGGPAARVSASKRVQVSVEVPVPAVTWVEGRRELKGRIDVAVDDPDAKLYIAIEAKMASSQHSSQLGRYREHIEQTRSDAAGWQRVFVLYSEHPEIPEDDPWVNVVYADLWPTLESAIAAATEHGLQDTRKLIEDFLYDQRRRCDTSHDEEIAHALLGSEPGAIDATPPGDLLATFAAAVIAFAIVDDPAALATRGSQAVTEAITSAESLSADELARLRDSLLDETVTLGLTEAETREILLHLWTHRPGQTIAMNHGASAEDRVLVEQLIQRLFLAFADLPDGDPARHDPEAGHVYGVGPELRQHGITGVSRTRANHGWTRGKGLRFVSTNSGGTGNFYISAGNRGDVIVLPQDNFQFNEYERTANHKTYRLNGLLPGGRPQPVAHWLQDEHFAGLVEAMKQGFQQIAEHPVSPAE